MNAEDFGEVVCKVYERIVLGEHYITLEDTDEILVYDKKQGIYKPGETYAKQAIQNNTDDKWRVSVHLINEVLALLRRKTYKSREIFAESNPHLVLENCLFNLESFKDESFTHEYHALAKMPVRYDNSIDYKKSKFWTFINEILSPADVIGVQEELGAILKKDYLTKKFSIYYGETDTGKTVLLNVIQALLGEKNVSNLSLQQIASKDRFYLSALFGKMANIRDDMPKDIIKTTGSLKEVTGRSRITGEYKFQNPFEFVNHAYIIVSCNELPPFEEDDLAIFNRIKLRAFKNRYGGHAAPDRDLESKLTTPEELSAILNFALEGLERLRRQNWNFSNAETEIMIRDLYKRKSDPIWGFVEDHLEEGDIENDYIEKQELYIKFKEYCKEKDLSDIGKDPFYRHLGDKITVRSGQRSINGKRPHCFLGLRFLNKKKGVQGVQNNPLDEQDAQDAQGSPYLTGACSICGKDGAQVHETEKGPIYLHPECESGYLGKI